LTFLFDASALVNVVVSRAEASVDITRGHGILDLTLYETGNALWKLGTIHRRISAEEASSLLAVTAKLSRRMTVISASETDLAPILGIAFRERASFYDSAYVHVAEERALELVTDDSRLMKIASKYVKVRRSTDL
jgi:predicted nucleic acid-binding protein